jgi:ATP-dependent exoDNAse (exonuclease V) alpha subunit
VEQQYTLATLTGPERLAVLIGPAGTGKGVVIDAAARAEQSAGQEVIGVAVSGSTAERLGADSPALQGRTLTLDALVARANTGRFARNRPVWSRQRTSQAPRSQRMLTEAQTPNEPKRQGNGCTQKRT